MAKRGRKRKTERKGYFYEEQENAVIEFIKTTDEKKKNKEYLETVKKVLVDGVSKNNPEMLTGRTESAKAVNFKGDESLTGKYVKVKITEAHTWSLNGEIIED